MLGKTDPKVDDLPRPIEKVLIHPEFSAEGKLYDIALIKLSDKVEFSRMFNFKLSMHDFNLSNIWLLESIQPIKLTFKEADDGTFKGTVASAVSFKVKKDNG
jgi:Trypsin